MKNFLSSTPNPRHYFYCHSDPDTLETTKKLPDFFKL